MQGVCGGRLLRVSLHLGHSPNGRREDWLDGQAKPDNAGAGREVGSNAGLSDGEQPMKRVPTIGRSRYAAQRQDGELWAQAASKLEEAALGIQEMRDATDRVSYEAGWARFVDCLEEFWSRFTEEGTRRFSSFHPWTTHTVCRSREPLLKYLVRAWALGQRRRLTLEWQDDVIRYVPDGSGGAMHAVTVRPDGIREVSDPSAPSSPKPTVFCQPGAARLPALPTSQPRYLFQPPMHFQGRPLHDPSPIGVAQVALEYYGGVLAAALHNWRRTPS